MRPIQYGVRAYPKLALNAQAEVFVQPYGDCCARLQKLENEVDRRKEDYGAVSVAVLDLTRFV
jgi:hypothetical protein